ncbi:pirin [Cordyceps militaris CM01]|uniref:Pirin n=1 Tax=Cordyceps militaris (strain CM01) TaxID=983644 RepID=G3J7Z0_CORMM|nr:pirin [Cordyceps militaris CM01]EGX97201.1 pirin [Cordyceps militaris CM01]
MLEKITRVYANHGMPIECDIYTVAEPVPDAPVALFFHAGALTGWGRDCVPPWLVQACYKQRWPLISASYRLMPQTGTDGLAEDVSAAYEFARTWDCGGGGEEKRRVIVIGASAGFFLASFLGRTANPPPLALFSIAGINSYTHPFYRSSTLVTPERTPAAAVAAALQPGPPIVGRSIPNGGHEGAAAFCVAALREDGSRDPDFFPPTPGADGRSAEERRMWDARALLYRYLIYENRWPAMVAALDGGREWEGWTAARRARWPPTVIFHGGGDTAVPLAVSERLREVMGRDRVALFVAEGQDHLFERAMFLEEERPGMDTPTATLAKLSAAKQQLLTGISLATRKTNTAIHTAPAAMTANASAVPRTIQKAFLAVEQAEGQGARVRRSIGTPALRHLTPFLMLDHFSIKPGAGFPDHPHRGQETITYLLEGAVDHEDFTGASGTINAGDLQFMTAGKGVQHAEMPHLNEDGSANVGLQLWVDLPTELKYCEPRYRDLRAAEIPQVEVDGGAATIKVISGQSHGVDSVKDLAYTPVWILDVTLRPGARVVQPLPPGWNAFAYVLEGDVVFGRPGDDADRRPVAQFHNAVFSQEGDAVYVENDPDAIKDARLVIVAGLPLDQKIVQYGPFVVNSKEEVVQAMTDFQTHTNGFERSKGWQSEIGKRMRH